MDVSHVSNNRNKNYIFDRELEMSNGVCIKISQLEYGDVGCVVWDAAIVLFHFIDINKFNFIRKNVIELGSGTGLIGIQAAINGANVTITDLEEFVPLMELNIKNNNHLIAGTIEVKCLKWGDDVSNILPCPDYLFVSDCLYYEESIAPLAKTINDLSHENTIVYLCYEVRDSEAKKSIEKAFFEIIGKTFDLENIPKCSQHDDFHSDDIKIIKMAKRTSS